MTSTVLPRRCIRGGVILLAGCLLLSACAGSGSSSSAQPASETGQGGAVAAPHSAATSGAGGSAGAKATAGGPSALTAGLTPAGQSIVYTATITVRSVNVAATARRITSLVEASGGYVSDESAGTDSRSATGETIDITLKIPVPAYRTVLTRLSSRALGKQLRRQQRATDVTQQVANVSSLVTSQEDAIAALEGLLKHAASVSDLLQVQQEISADETTLNSLLAQQRALNGETTYATVTMTLLSPAHSAPRRNPAHHSFMTGLLAGWRALRHAAGWAATGLGAALPFLITVVVLAGLGYAGRQRYVRHRAGSSAAG